MDRWTAGQGGGDGTLSIVRTGLFAGSRAEGSLAGSLIVFTASQRTQCKHNNEASGGGKGGERVATNMTTNFRQLQ